MRPVIGESELRELGRTHGSPKLLAQLADGQRTRRLLLLRALLDAADEAPAPTAARVREHWQLLESAERCSPEAARRVVHYPLVGTWAAYSLRLLLHGAAAGQLDDLAHLGAIAAAAAARAGLAFRLRLPSKDGMLCLPTLGALRCPGSAQVTISGTGTRLRLTPDRGRTTEIRCGAGDHATWRSSDSRWKPLSQLGGVGRPVLLDDADRYRVLGGDGEGTPSGTSLDHRQQERWQRTWHETLPILHVGGDQRPTDLDALLDCVVPLADQSAVSPHGAGATHRSGTRHNAFGAVLSSQPSGPQSFAATLVHELQHTKLSALSELVPLHTADNRPRHWAPWRPDPRPFEGLLHGCYAHLALSAHWQTVALAAKDPADRDRGWAEHARCREQINAVLPLLAGSRHLTPNGRVLVAEMEDHLARLKEIPPPDGHVIRAGAYVETAWAVWRRRHAR
ncbi:HEXXH motif domain-containing protein [Streptomyces sp. NPDC014892]|uniref:HEXXH motif domain-containing protein n=1 Tax=Streptomyces sp. NPDC014892 TaxID=3364930 RepID=UPI0036FADFF7